MSRSSSRLTSGRSSTPRTSAEDGGVRADAERQREHHGDGEPFGARERADCRLQLTEEIHDGFDRRSVSLNTCSSAPCIERTLAKSTCRPANTIIFVQGFIDFGLGKHLAQPV